LLIVENAAFVRVADITAERISWPMKEAPISRRSRSARIAKARG
jgi:hypothetical protein